MNCKEIYKRLKNLKIDAAYHHFNGQPHLPFVVYLISSGRRYGADDINLIKERTVRIELYTEAKDEKLEDEVADLFSEYDLEEDEDYIEDQQLYLYAIEFEDKQKLTGG